MAVLQTAVLIYLHLSTLKIHFGDNPRAEPTTFFKERILFSLKLLFCQFNGQYCIKNARGSLSCVQ